MNREQLEQMVKAGESNHIEYKECGNRVPDSFYETVVSFSNTDGGTILLGVDDDKNIKGVKAGKEEKIKTDVITALNSPDCISPPIFVDPIIHNIDGNSLISVYIPSSSQVHKHGENIYVRDHESDIDITNNQKRLSELYNRKRTQFTESNIYPNLSMADLDEALFEKARKLIKANKSDHPWLYLENEELLRESILYRKDYQTGKEGLTLASALIFGKDITIQSLLPAYKVEAMVRIENVDRWDDRLTLRTNLIDTYQQLKAFVYKHLPEKFYLEGDQRVDLRDKVFREVIGNAIVHREYTSALSTDLIIGRNKVLITNPNKALFHGPIDPLSFNPYPKNPNIRKFFTSFGWTDEIGSGIRNTNKWLPRYIPNSKPVFIENDVFKTVIPLKVEALGNFAESFRKWLQLSDDYDEHISEGLQNIPLPTSLADASFKEVLTHLVPSWTKVGTKLKRLDWANNEISSKDEVQKVSSWYQDGTKLLHKKTVYLIQILTLASKAISLDDMMNAIGYKNRASFRKNYLDALESVELVTKTIPDKPNSPDQKYAVTEKGKLFLAGYNFELNE
ncbi:MAG: putative DNA binding domain-containing protein [Balneolaceae bacterium]|nr:putative DNA binding domain-containing protein [Balneolaceae bacterium]